MNWIKYALEKSLFGVCSQLGEKMNISTKSKFGMHSYRFWVRESDSDAKTEVPLQ